MRITGYLELVKTLTLWILEFGLFIPEIQVNANAKEIILETTRYADTWQVIVMKQPAILVFQELSQRFDPANHLNQIQVSHILNTILYILVEGVST
jgi:hypothetical protein